MSGAQVDTDESVLIYGVENGWVLVSYTIGNGSRGRMGYIDDSTLADAENVAKLGFCSIPITLASDCDGTDDPLNAKETLTSLKAGDQVTLLAFMGDEWAVCADWLGGSCLPPLHSAFRAYRRLSAKGRRDIHGPQG